MARKIDANAALRRQLRSKPDRKVERDLRPARKSLGREPIEKKPYRAPEGYNKPAQRAAAKRAAAREHNYDTNAVKAFAARILRPRDGTRVSATYLQKLRVQNLLLEMQHAHLVIELNKLKLREFPKAFVEGIAQSLNVK